MKSYLALAWLVVFITMSHYCCGQYSISGYLDSTYINKRVYLSLLRYDEQNAISDDQILTSTFVDSSGYFSITGKLLSNKHKMYRIHANLEADSLGLDFADTDEIKNYHNFIFSNSDTLVLKTSGSRWFSPIANTNLVDKEWRKINLYKISLRKEFSRTINVEARTHSSSQFLSELKSYFRETKTHPLIKLILLSEIQENNLRKDFEKDSEFYLTLQKELNSYFSSKSYALQLDDLISKLAIAKTQQQLNFYKQLVYILGVISLLLLFIIILLLVRTKKHPITSKVDTITLTNQEEKIAELIIQEKTNKEIASDLFISLSTVKTHIRNLYAKYEVSNRQQFTDKIKNQPRD